MDVIRLASSIKDLKSFNLWQSLIAELVGTFLLVFVGFGSSYGNFNPVKLGLGIGMTAAVIIYCFGPVSGGHINPAVSFGFLIARQISLIRFVLYFIIQVVGAALGFGCILFVTNGYIFKRPALIINLNNNILLNGTKFLVDINPSIGPLQSKMLCEVIITFLLVFTVHQMCVEKTRTSTEKGIAIFIVGLSITVGVFCGVHISGASMNPAVSLGKTFYARSPDILAHTVGPLIGSFIAAVSHQLFFTTSLSRQHIKDYLFSKDFDDQPSSSDKTTDTLLNDFEKKGDQTKDHQKDIDEEKSN